MPVLLSAGGEPLKDAAGNELKTGQTVIDGIFGEGVVKGTVPLAQGEGLNVLIDWLGPKNPSKPTSRSAETLTAKYSTVAEEPTVRRHTGAGYESGAVFAARGRNDADAARLRRENGQDMGEPAGAQSPPQRRAAGAAADQTPHSSERTQRQQQRAEEGGSHEQPWLGKAAKFDTVGKEIISHYTHQIVNDRKLDGGSVILVRKIRYRTKYEPESKTRTMGDNFPITRLGEYLLSSEHTPPEVKEAVARKMRSQKAKDFVRALDSQKRAGEDMHTQLQAMAKSSKAGDVHDKLDERSQLITQYVARDAPMPSELFKLVLYYLSIAVFMLRLPFSTVTSVYFMRFLWALRPNFAKQIVPRTLMDMLANDLLDEAYEETQEITAKALAAVPGRPTLGMDGHKEAKHRHVETITRAKLGVSSFAGAEYMRTVQTTGKALSRVALKYLTPVFIALVADNTGNNTGEEHGMFAHVLMVLPTLFCLGCYVHVHGKPFALSEVSRFGPQRSVPLSWQTCSSKTSQSCRS